MVEKRPLLDFITHAVLIVGAISALMIERQRHPALMPQTTKVLVGDL